MKCFFCTGEVKEYQWGGVTCTTCLSVLVKEPPSTDDLYKFYNNYLEYYHGGGKNNNGSKERQLNWANLYLKSIKKYVPEGKLMDIGPANNPFPNLASESGYSVTVVDFKPPKILSPNVKFVTGSIGDSSKSLNTHYGKYDVVTCWAVLEHCLNIDLAIKTLINLCKPGGYIILTTPQVGSIADRFGAGRTPWFYPPEHIYLISPMALNILFVRHRCEIVTTRTIELSALRWFTRWMLTMAEGLVGIALKLLAPSVWCNLRENRVTKAMGITFAVYRRI